MALKKFQIRIRRGDARYSYGFAKTIEESEQKRDMIEKRLDKEERDGHIVGSRGELLRTRINIKGRWFNVTGSESTGHSAILSLETLKDELTSDLREIPRKVLFDMTRKNKNDE